jgi:hypothetical protein
MRRFAVVLCAFMMIGLAAPSRGQPLPDPRDVPPDRCPAEGSAKSKQGKEINILKNRDIAPVINQFDRAVTLEAMLARGYDVYRFDEGRGAVITGWVVDVTQGGHPETANCGSMSKLYTDTHITVGLSPNARERDTLVVEVTPSWRQMMRSQGVDWTTERLRQTLVGRQVQFTGWLMFDDDHFCEAVNTRPAKRCQNRKKKNLWRKTVWEIHPVTGIQIVQ